MLVIIDYGVGNLASVRNAFLKVGTEAIISSKAKDILDAERVVLPGVGAFADAMQSLQNYRLAEVVKEVARRGTPLLGICLGLHLLFTRSEEHGLHTGLDLIKGSVVKFDLPRAYKVPHMGWNQVIPRETSRLFKGIAAGSHCYFVHSYYVVPEDSEVIAAHSDYGLNFVCAIEKDNLFATQFHPEKSGEIGLKILQNFINIS